MDIVAAFMNACPDGFEVPDWASVELRLTSEGAAIRFFSYADGHVFSSGLTLPSDGSPPDEYLRIRLDAALENLRTGMEREGIPVPSRRLECN